MGFTVNGINHSFNLKKCHSISKFFLISNEWNFLETRMKIISNLNLNQSSNTLKSYDTIFF